MSTNSLNVIHQSGDKKDDVFYGDGRNDIIDAGNGNNIVYAGEGENVITAGSGDDIIYSDSGNDVINAGDGANNVYAGEGNNRVNTGAGKDAIYTGAGNDIISSGAGDDLIQAGEGNNTIDAGTGNDRVIAGFGADIFKLNKGDGFTTIYGVGLNDRLSLTGKAEDYKIESVGGNQKISTKEGDVIALVEGVTDLIAYAGANPSNEIYLASKDSNLFSRLNRIAETDVFNLKGGDGKPKLQINITARSSNQVNELGVFIVDDATGKINGIAPGAAGYAEAALKRAQVILSAISNAPNNFKAEELKRSLEFTNDNNLRFYLIKNGTTDSVLSGNTPFSSVLFSDPNSQKVSVSGDGSFSLGWKDGTGNNADFNNLVVKIQPSDQPLELGTNLQAKKEGEVIDIRNISGNVKANFSVYREAAFNNLVGFYKVVDEFGGIDTNNDGKADILPGQAGYAQAAMKGRIEDINLKADNQGTATFNDKSLAGGTILAPFIITNGATVDQVIAGQTNQVYFAYLGANPDKVDHIRLLGNNTFGFEDIAGGGDLDYNDIIIQANFKI
jgi:Domain of unknown function (DUF4114)/RTX calcium-binding nonapeptide repeat (4 copies)